MKAIYLAIKASKSSWEGCKHIRIRSDNTTPIAYINNMGGLVSNSCNHLERKKSGHIVQIRKSGYPQFIYRESIIILLTICSDYLMKIQNGG